MPSVIMRSVVSLLSGVKCAFRIGVHFVLEARIRMLPSLLGAPQPICEWYVVNTSSAAFVRSLARS